MVGFLHRKITYEACLKAGFSSDEAQKTADASVKFDSVIFFKPFGHFEKFGALVLSRIFLKLAVWFKSFDLLGWALHSLQDGISHGKIYPWQHKEFESIDTYFDEETLKTIAELSQSYAERFKKG